MVQPCLREDYLELTILISKLKDLGLVAFEVPGSRMEDWSLEAEFGRNWLRRRIYLLVVLKKGV